MYQEGIYRYGEEHLRNYMLTTSGLLLLKKAADRDMLKEQIQGLG